MASNSSINGLNLIPSPSQNSPKDSEEMGLEIDPQLQFDLWTNFPFGGSATTSTLSEEPYFSAERDTASRSRHKNRDGSVPRSSSQSRVREEKQESAETTPAPSLPAVNENLLNSLNSLYPYMALQQLQQQHGRINPLMFPWAAANPLAFPPLQQQQQLDALLSGFPVDPFLVPPLPAFGNGAFPGTIAQSLPPLTIRDSKGNKNDNQSEQERVLAIDPALSLKTTSNTAASSPDNTARPAKKQRLSTSKATTTTAAVSDRDSPIEATPTPTSAKATSSSTSTSTAGAAPPTASAKPNATPLTAAEDKRRRNTAASARFRLKKKEREAAMETRAKELEDRVVELERECETLKKENGWLKGLVVGATTGDGLGSDGLEELLTSVKNGGAPDLLNPRDFQPITAPVVEERVGSKRKRGSAA